jgi:hypothetical protein
LHNRDNFCQSCGARQGPLAAKLKSDFAAPQLKAKEGAASVLPKLPPRQLPPSGAHVDSVPHQFLYGSFCKDLEIFGKQSERWQVEPNSFSAAGRGKSLDSQPFPSMLSGGGPVLDYLSPIAGKTSSWRFTGCE